MRPLRQARRPRRPRSQRHPAPALQVKRQGNTMLDVTLSRVEETSARVPKPPSEGGMRVRGKIYECERSSTRCCSDGTSSTRDSTSLRARKSSAENGSLGIGGYIGGAARYVQTGLCSISVWMVPRPTQVLPGVGAADSANRAATASANSTRRSMWPKFSNPVKILDAP